MPERLHDISIPAQVRQVCERLRSHGERAWIVGGCMRDLLRGEEVADWDIATSARPQAVQRIFERVIPTGIDHGTVTVLVGDDSYEVTTLRGEGAYTDGRRPDSVSFVNSIEADLARRDFTVNAIAFDPIDQDLVDPFGGMADMDARVLRAVGDPKERFQEDGLRILRGARFVATLEFELEPDTERAFEQALETFKKVSAERVRDEWLKAMKANKPSRAFNVMRRTGILGVTYPELLDQVGCEQNRWHAYDVWRHTMEVLDAAEPTPIDRMAALLHDVGKPRTRARSDKTGEWTFYHHETIGADMANRWLRDYRFSNDERDHIVHLVRHHLICYDSEWSDAAVRRFIRRVQPERVDALLRLAHADALGKGLDVTAQLAALEELRGRIQAAFVAGSALSASDLAISGGDLLSFFEGGPGPWVGALMRHLLDQVLEDPELNDRERLLALAQQLAPEFERRHAKR